MQIIQETDNFIIYRLVLGESESQLPRPSVYHYRSASHSGDDYWIVYANTPVGLDVAQSEVPNNFLEIAHSYFTAEDQTDLNSTPASLQPLRFLHLWTEYEAKAKWAGTGLQEC